MRAGRSAKGMKYRAEPMPEYLGTSRIGFLVGYGGLSSSRTSTVAKSVTLIKKFNSRINSTQRKKR